MGEFAITKTQTILASTFGVCLFTLNFALMFSNATNLSIGSIIAVFFAAILYLYLLSRAIREPV